MKPYNNLLDADIQPDLKHNLLSTVFSYNLDFKKYKKVVADFFGVNVSVMTANNRDRQYSNCNPRAIAMFFIAKYTNISRWAIAVNFGYKCHSATTRSIQRVENSLFTKQLDVKLLHELERKIFKSFHK